MYIIVGLIIALIIVVITVNAIQQHKEKQLADKRKQMAKYKAIIDETEELLLNLGNLPHNPKLVEILNRRSLNAGKAMMQILPDNKIKQKINELDSRLKAAEELSASGQTNDDTFMLPDNEQHLVAILQTIKKLRAALKSEQSKGTLDAQTFLGEDLRLESMQLKISIESLIKRGTQAFNKEMIGSARQYFEKALQSLNNHPHKTEYVQTKQNEISDKLEEITNMLKSTNAQDRAKKAKNEEDDLDLLFQPKKKW
jgi:hypothetical protein